MTAVSASLPAYAASTLYGVTGENGVNAVTVTPETLFVLNQRTAASTFVLTLGNGEDGEAIAFNPTDRLMYHWSGLIEESQVMESIDLKTLVVTNIPQTGDAHQEIFGATWDNANGRFLLSETLVRMFGATPDGIFTNIGPFTGASDKVRGLAFARGRLYGVEVKFPLLHTIDPATGVVLTTVTGTAPGVAGTLLGFNALATNPDDGRLWTIARFTGNVRHLGTLSRTGIFKSVGILSDNFASIAFVPDLFGTLDSALQIRYASNLTAGDSVVNIINTGANGNNLYGPGFGEPAGNICVNVYAFSPDEQMVSCCSCMVTPNGLVNLTANRDLVSNTLTGIRPDSIVIKLVATGTGKDDFGDPTYAGSNCSNSAALAGTVFPVARVGLLAWGTTLHSASGFPLNPGDPFRIAETPFSSAKLDYEELESLRSRCANIVGNGSTFGQCRSCRQGGLGAGKF